MRIEIKALHKHFPGGDAARPALNGVDLTVEPGELVALLGPSGSGKTTLLRAIAGLEEPSAGDILFNGRNAAHTDVRDRNVGFVFQHYALFRTMTVLENVAFGLKVRPRATRPGTPEILARARDLLALVQLEAFENRYPAQLSGGQRQRVALARALAIEPVVLLLDEPFGALDARVRKDLRRWLRDLHDRTGHTTLFVTHDQEEALELADRVAIVNHGRIEQVAPPAELYRAPVSPFVYEFLGSVNVLPVAVRDGRVLAAGGTVLAHSPAPDGEAYRLYVRPHDLRLSPPGASPGEVPPGDADGLPATIAALRLGGSLVRVDCMVPGLDRPIEVELPVSDPRWPGWRKGDALTLTAEAFRLFPG